jgi:hypothetical protein
MGKRRAGKGRVVNMKRIWASALIAGAASLAWSAEGEAAPASEPAASSVQRGNVLTLRKTRPALQDHRAALQPFVHSATAGDVTAVVNAFDEVPLRANGSAAIEHFAAHEVLPFFLDAKRLSDEIRVTKGMFEDGTEGLMAYTYVLTAAGEAKPFVIAFRGGPGPLRVMDLQLGRCVKDRHPVSTGHCDR